jgi:hypothetical protein
MSNDNIRPNDQHIEINRRLSFKPFFYMVEGDPLTFPADMLRRDDSQPSTDEDADTIKALIQGFERTADNRKVSVMLTSSSRHAPLVDRWESFGWKVVSCTNPLMPIDQRVGGASRGKREIDGRKQEPHYPSVDRRSIAKETPI